MASTKVFVTDTLPDEARRVLSGFEVFENDASEGAISEYQALVCWPSRVKRELLQKMTGLRMVQTISAGVDALDFRSLPAGAQVFSNAGAFTDTVAEHAWGLLLGVAKGVHQRNADAKPRALKGRVLLVIGAGNIGSEVARLSKSLGMKTIGVSRSFRSPAFFDEMHPLSALGQDMAAADAVVIALPLTKATRGIIDYQHLSRAKDQVVVANVGRGETVSEKGLVRWLRERPESRFATDVFWKSRGKEVFTTQAWELKNFAGTLHTSATPIGQDLVGPKVAAAMNVRRFFETGSALNRVKIDEYL